MATYAEDFFEQLKSDIGRRKGTSDWFVVTSDVVEHYAAVTRDRSDGLLVMSLLSHFNTTLKDGDAAPPSYDGLVAGINYGFDRVRFVHPLGTDARIRATSVIKDVTRKGDAVDEVTTVTVEIDGEDEPALIADWIIRWVFSPKEHA